MQRNAYEYGDRWAAVYDAMYDGTDTDSAVACLAKLAGAGPVLELGVGTGRLALPLAERGLDVWGIEGSERMIEQLRAKSGSDAVTVHHGDFAEARLDRTFSMVFVTFNTFFALTTQQEQVRGFHNVARHLAAGGVFVMEAFVPDLGRFSGGQTARTVHVDGERAVMELSIHDAAHQLVETQTVILSPQGTQLLPNRIRYAWPSELDLMAQLAGLTLSHRWADWHESAFGSRSGMHVSVYRETE